tara:strand:- start:132 stop:569 length:438 start_codon:yes stop_codon:yes gene_type:complete
MNLSENFTLLELTHSQEATRAGLDNIPTTEHIKSLNLLCANILQPLRDLVNRPIVISSGYRSINLNRLIGGSILSQHTIGQAADFTIPGLSIEEIIATIKALKLPVDQCINEFDQWVHISYRHNRGQYLAARKKDGGVIYKLSGD